MSVENLDSTKFNEKLIDGKEVALVDFYADWCAPCKLLGPVIDAISEEYKDKLKFYKVNVEKESGIAGAYSVMSIPTVMFFKNSISVDTFAGSLPKEKVKEFIDKNLK